MTKAAASKKEYDQVGSDSGSPSEVSINAEDKPLVQSQKGSQIRTNVIKCSGALVILIVLAVLTQGGQTDRSSAPLDGIFEADPVPFKFRVHCPVEYYSSYLNNLKISLESGGNEDLRRRLSEADGSNVWSNFVNRFQYGPYEFTTATTSSPKFDPSRLYVVTVASVDDSKHGGEGVSLRYCSLMRDWNGSCDNAQYYCVTPGAMFNFNVGEYQDVIWVNELKPTLMPDNGTGSCLTEGGHECQIKAKTDYARTFHTPTDLGNDDWHVQDILPNYWPSVTHIHGLEVRPNFDGNPLTWISNNQENQTAGIGFMDLENHCYYRNFQTADNNNQAYDPPSFYKFKENRYNIISKSNRYPNAQNPGNLWYHDHAMRLTRYNVQNGLSGIYIIRDPEVEVQLPRGKYEKFIMYEAKDNWENQEDEDFEANHYYRYRILNNNPGGGTIQVRFISDPNGQGNCSDFVSGNLLPFYMMGADSSIFSTVIEVNGHRNFVQLGAAERIEILIKFSENFKICADSEEFSTASKADRKKTHREFSFKVRNVESSGSDYPPNFNPETLNFTQQAPYINLNDTAPNAITVSKTRMRPIMIDSNDGPSSPHFKLNGHYEFGKGASDNPVIGTTEDWWLINLSGGEHPIHVHLINFQVVEYVALRQIGSCDLYNAEFNLEAMKHHAVVGQANFTALNNYFNNPDNANGVYSTRYEVFCAFHGGAPINSTDPLINGKYYTNFSLDIEQAAYEVSVEDQFDANNVSGIDVLRNNPGNDAAYTSFIGLSNCPANTANLYFCEYKNDDIPLEYRRWKDTAMIPAHGAYKYRVRWAKSAYNYNHPEDDFFHVPVDQIREFPGYVYHCHILGHEDNEMMRSIMMLPPESADLSSDNFPCDETPWNDKSDCLYRECKDNIKRTSWKQRLLQE